MCPTVLHVNSTPLTRAWALISVATKPPALSESPLVGMRMPVLITVLGGFKEKEAPGVGVAPACSGSSLPYRASLHENSSPTSFQSRPQSPEN